MVTVVLERDGVSGMGECVPLKRYQHTPDSIRAEIEGWLAAGHGWTREILLGIMRAGPARFALDTAMWQLEAAEKNMSFKAYFLSQFPETGTISDLPTAFTLSGAAPEIMAEAALQHQEFRWLKLKLMGDGLDAQRLCRIHDAVPDKALLVDANEAFTPEMLDALLPLFQSCNVTLIEQPFPAGNDDALRDREYGILIAADESCHDADSLEALRGKYDVVNLKLDKTGGLTHALAMKARAQQMGFTIMVGCMASTSLSILPAFFLAQDAAFIDLDGALLLAQDRENSPLCYSSGHLSLIQSEND